MSDHFAFAFFAIFYPFYYYIYHCDLFFYFFSNFFPSYPHIIGSFKPPITKATLHTSSFRKYKSLNPTAKPLDFYLSLLYNYIVLMSGFTDKIHKYDISEYNPQFPH